MKTITRNFYSDGGHGWLKVKFSELLKLNIQDKISAYSYMRNGDVFLEEDGDLTTYCSALKEINTEIKFIEHQSNKSSKIRNYDRYENTTIVLS